MLPKTPMKPSIRKRGENGNSMVEFAVVAPFWIAVLFGTVAIGTNLTRTIQVVQISRDLGNMYAQGTDFSATGMQNLITGNSGNSASLVQGMDLSSTGNAVIYLSQVRHVYSTDADCSGGSCANVGKDVFVNRIKFGNTTLLTSFLGDPDSSDLDTKGNTKTATTDTSDRTTQNALFPATYTFPGKGYVAYIAEVYMSSPDIAFLSMAMGGMNLSFGKAGNYSRAVF